MAENLTSRLPLHLPKSETIAPAPTRPEFGSEPVADFIYNFSTHSWIAYAASPLLVISHFPNPLSDAETKVGPIYRQVIELDLNTVVSSVNAVAWSPVSPSVGELAVAWNDCVDLFSCDESSFCWRQTMKLQQATKVEAIKWTGSGDGIISGGVEVVMWRRQDTSWEIAWKFKPDVPQALVSTTWSAEGFSATAHYGKFSNAGPFLKDASNCVLVCQGEDDTQYVQTELRHPVSVTMIQWRPLRPSNGHSGHARRPILLTCCIDGSARLWSEIDDGRIRRTGRDNTDQKSTKLSFCVVAVVEVNQTLKGFLGSNVFVCWATEIEGVTVIGKETHYYARLDDDSDTTGRCEWLVGFGPKRTVTLWAVHCLDDTAPVRFPRITLWKKQELVDSEFEASQLLLNKVLVMRNRVFGPPLVCSLVHLLDCNYFSWTLLHSGASSNGEEPPAIESAFLSYAEGILKVGGHTGKVLQIAIHPFSMDLQIAASMDANGMLLFWSYLAFSDCYGDPPTSAPSWKLCGGRALSQSPSYTCMSWAPVALGKDRIFFMGHTSGVDCFIITIPKVDDEKISFHYLFSTPFKTESREQGLTRIDLIPLRSSCDENIISTKFLLVALRMDGFQALSWELTFSYELQTSESAFFSSKYSYSVNPCSSIFPSPHDEDKVTSCAVVCPIDLSNVDEKDSCSYAYHLMTGCSNGSLKLWRSMPGVVNWGLVGLLTSKQSPIMTVSCSACCRKIATGSTISHPSYSSTLCIWECMQVHDAGGFVLEHELSFDVEIVAINWLVLGNGQLLLGVCLRNELRVYAQSRCGSRELLKQGNHFEGNAWVCIAVNSALPPINDFCWGPKGTAIAVHDGYFSLFSCSLPIAYEDDMKSSVNIESWQGKGNLANKVCFCSMAEVAEKIGGSVYLFHPESLLSSIYSGNWKRAFVALRHLVKHLGYRNNSGKRNCANMHRNIISPVPLSNYLEGNFSHSSGEKSFQWSSSQVDTGFSQLTPFGAYSAPDTALSSSTSGSEFDDFTEAVERLYAFTCITEVEKMQTLALIDLLQEISNPHSVSAYGSLDEPGRMFWVAVRFQQLFFARRLSRPPLAEDLVVSSEMIGWAFHSDCLDNLFSSLLSSSEPSWVEMRGIGAGFWYTDATQLRAKMERLARQQYMKNRDPKACTLLYIALNRIQVLAGLFKISKDERDKPLAGFLSRNFKEDKNKGAALKNAYVLMGKHQLELAIAFFLLGGDASSAVNVCVKNLGDEQLALVICRLVEGYNGSLERSLISKILLPSALEKGDFWMASLFEWILGNYSRSYFRMLDFKLDSEFDISLLTSLHSSFMDPSIGQYCLLLATKTSMKNAVGEHNAAVLCGWAALMSVTSLSRSGLPLEALECLASSVNIFGHPTQGSDINGSPCNSLAEMLKSSINSSSSNWISDTISCHFMSHSKLSLTMQYISKLLKEHPSYIETNKSSDVSPITQMGDSQEFEKSLKEFREDLTSSIIYFEQKFLLFPLHILRMVVLSLHHCGMEFIGQVIMEEYLSGFQPQDKSNKSVNQSNLLKAADEFSCIFVKYIATSCQNWSHLMSFRNTIAGGGRYSWGFSCVGIARSFKYIRAMFRLFLRSHSNDHMKLLFNSLGLFEYLVLFASSCLQRNEKALAVALRPILATLTERDINYDFTFEDLNKILIEIVDMLARSSSCTESGTDFGIIKQQAQHGGASSLTVLEDKRWPIISSSLWVHMCTFLDHQLDTLPTVDLIDNKELLQVGLMREFVKLACADVSYYCSKHFASYLLQEVNVKIASNLLQLEDGLSLGNCEVVESVNSLEEPSILFDFEQLLHICANPKIILGAFSLEYHNWQPFFKHKSSSGWIDAYIGITREFDSEETSYKEDKLDSPNHAGGSPLACLSPDDHPFKSSSDKDLSEYNKVTPFDSPKEVHKRNGELLEALCLNSTDECQAGLASNKKGIIFFNWEDGVAHGDKSEYIWGKAEWPHNGWAGSKSDPVPTCVSPGVGLGRKKGTHLGLGGATIGDLARPSRHIRGSGSFDISSNADMEASGLGWGVQENFDEFIDPPATVDNVRTSAFASHPYRPFFLVGSSNTHIYLWKFGQDTATATYGVLPAANVAPPYALASVSSVRFDHCGQRFVTGALDGTVCTWQIEVGGRNNVRPTESSSCFNNHTSDVTYVTASGSIVAAAGHSSSGVNVVVWDTLAPPSTSQASIMCHEGGARSLAVFDNDIGSGSISPLILTGGKNGDVGLHDFRYIATGRTKRQKQSDSGEHQHNMTTSSSSSVDMRSKTGDQNRNGMLWYIPKAHSGSVTKITTIPNTSFFLTGSKDGDVKLWDAKRAKLVFHWPRLNDRHTFLQSSTRGFGGVVRAGVTDIQVVSHGFLSCGGDGSVKFVRFKDFSGTN